jgi:SOS response regulatory protein OraA/RecX
MTYLARQGFSWDDIKSALNADWPVIARNEVTKQSM